LIGVTRKIKVLPKFFLSFFPRQIEFESEEIAFDRVSSNYNQVAPFVFPTAQGRIMREEGFQRLAFKPAYLKPKNVVDPNMTLPVQPGEAALRGSLSNAQKRAAVIAHLVMKQDASIENRWEWMAAQAALYGYVDVEGEDYPKVRVDFGRDSALTISTDWRSSNSARNPMEDLKTARFLVSDKSASGAVVRDWVFGGDAWNLFWSAHKTEIIDLMKTDTRGSTTEVTRVWDGLEGVEFMGTIAGINGQGRINIWVNTQRYKDTDGALKYMMPQNAVWGATDALEGVRCFGAIMEATIGYQAAAKYPKNWINQDPSVEYIMTQSAPLMVPVDPNSSVLLIVSP
jgi:hypothetical protein